MNSKTAVIISTEYAHFLTDTCANSISPGTAMIYGDPMACSKVHYYCGLIDSLYIWVQVLYLDYLQGQISGT